MRRDVLTPPYLLLTLSLFCVVTLVTQHWCIIVNEFGAVGIDAVALQSSAAAAAGDTVVIKQIAGGCMCCAQSGVLLPAIAQIIRQTRPDRLLIEPSGLGHPAGEAVDQAVCTGADHCKAIAPCR